LKRVQFTPPPLELRPNTYFNTVDIREATIRRQLKDLALNDECMKTELDLLEKLREKAKTKEETCKQRVSRRYNAKVRSRSYQNRDLDWRMTGNAWKDAADSKFPPNWEVSYRVNQSLSNGVVRLEH